MSSLYSYMYHTVTAKENSMWYVNKSSGDLTLKWHYPFVSQDEEDALLTSDHDSISDGKTLDNPHGENGNTPVATMATVAAFNGAANHVLSPSHPAATATGVWTTNTLIYRFDCTVKWNLDCLVCVNTLSPIWADIGCLSMFTCKIAEWDAYM